MKQMSWWGAWGFVLVALGSPALAAVDMSASELIQVQGHVEVRKGEGGFKKVPLNLRLAGSLKRLDGGDNVKTRLESAAELALAEVCVVAIKENTLFEVPATLGDEGRLQLRAKEGSLLIKVVTGSQFEVQTADVVAGVKGTLFEVEVVDDLRGILLLPGLELGSPMAGGTVINVYEGEVELTHEGTKHRRKLLAGEGIAAVSPALMGLDDSMADGFGQIRKLEVKTMLRERFGTVGERLRAVASTREALGNLDLALVKLPTRIGRVSQRVERIVEAMPGKALKKLRKIRLERGVLAPLRRVGVLEKRKADFDASGFPVEEEAVVLKGGEIKVIHLGEGLFMGMVSSEGAAGMTVAPEGEGFGLKSGEGSFRIADVEGNLDALVTVRGGKSGLQTSVQIRKGTLRVRLPGGGDDLDFSQGSSTLFQRGSEGGAIQVLPGKGALSDGIEDLRMPFDPKKKGWKNYLEKQKRKLPWKRRRRSNDQR